MYSSVRFTKPRIMGVLNITPDSFSDGGKFFHIARALEQALSMRQEGADIIDVGGESTRPGAQAVSEQEEMDRVIPVIEQLRKQTEITISIDTYKPGVMRAAVAAGASLINDIMALQHPGALETAADLQVPVCLMHMQGQPQTMQQHPHYNDVIEDIMTFFAARINEAVSVGIRRENLILDPGFGFGKTVQHNLKIIKHLQKFKEHFKLPMMIGVSRKSTVGKLLSDAPVNARIYGSLALNTISYMYGATIIRTHDVKATADALTIAHAVLNEE